MTDHAARARQLINDCRGHEYASSRLAMAQEAVRAADLSNDLRTRIDARTELIRTATFCGRPEIALTHFAWNLANYDDEDFGGWDIWYQFCWITEDVPNVLAVPRAEVEHILDEMEDVFRRNSWWRYPLYIARFRTGVVFGEDEATLRRHLGDYADNLTRYGEATPHDWHVLADGHLRLGNWDAGLRAAAHNFEGDVDEPEYPHHTHSIVTLPMMLLDRLDEAKHHHEAAVRLCDRNPVFLRQMGRQVTFAAHMANWERVLELVERHLIWAIENYDRCSAMQFYLAAGWAMNRLPKSEVALRLPEEFEHFDDDGHYDVDELAGHLWQTGLELAGAFDQRHGNEHWRELAAEVERRDDAVVLFNPLALLKGE